MEAAKKIGLPIEVIKTDGERLVVIQRTDLDLISDEDSSGMNRARLLAYADNRAGEMGLEWSPEVIMGDVESGVILSPYFTDEEVEEILSTIEPKSLEELEDEYGEPDPTAFWPLIRTKVEPGVHNEYQRILEENPGKEEWEVMKVLIQRYRG
jgi:hypothetical protein